MPETAGAISKVPRKLLHPSSFNRFAMKKVIQQTLAKDSKPHMAAKSVLESLTPNCKAELMKLLLQEQTAKPDTDKVAGAMLGEARVEEGE